MAQNLVQDYVRMAMDLERGAFCQKVTVPILVAEREQVEYSFRQGQTHLSKDHKPSPLARELIRRGNQLEVLELRQVRPGPVGHIRVGRSQENDLLLRHLSVSSRHAAFVQDAPGAIKLQDLGSINGTHVNGSRLVVGKPVLLFDGDSLSFGDLAFVFFYPGGFFDVLRADLDALGTSRS